MPAAPQRLPGLPDAIVLRPSSAIVARAGVLDAPLLATYPVPVSSTLLGAHVTWQGATLDAVGGLQVSNGVTYVHD
ncbi:MAG: hypothetical protein IPM29_20345 [Planctomycetes bacterium]|nr:hypothetical protein [Planctomycetota bacterium]